MTASPAPTPCTSPSASLASCAPRWPVTYADRQGDHSYGKAALGCVSCLPSPLHFSNVPLMPPKPPPPITFPETLIFPTQRHLHLPNTCSTGCLVFLSPSLQVPSVSCHLSRKPFEFQIWAQSGRDCLSVNKAGWHGGGWTDGHCGDCTFLAGRPGGGDNSHPGLQPMRPYVIGQGAGWQGERLEGRGREV